MSAFAEQAGFSTQGDLTLIIARLIRTALSFLGIIVLLLILYGGFLWMTASGDETRVTRAKQVLANAVIGLVIVLSSFAIAQFVVGRLSEATGTTVGFGPGGGGGGGFFGDGGSSGQFVMTSGNAQCAGALQNFRPQLVFSANVDDESVQAGGITVTLPGGGAVAGSFVVSGKKVSFVPDQACAAPDTDERCFPSDTDVVITLNPAVLKSAAGRPLTCSVLFPCSLSMHTGTGVDTRGPTLAMDAPEDGASAIVNDIVLLQSRATDDTGVSTVEFSVDGEEVFTASLAQSTEGTLAPDNFFFTDASQWDTAGFATNERYRLAAVGEDCAGHSVPASSVDLVLRAANCANTVADTDLGETAVDCGGDSGSDLYCGACVDAPCTSNSECSTGMCANGVCASVARVDRVSPFDGAVGNLVTINGVGFGDAPGTVTFLGSESGDETVVGDFSCGGTIAWSDRQIVVRVPTPAADGPMLVRTADDLSDRTDDSFGPFIADFDVNDIVRPGLCSAAPASGPRGTQVALSGMNLGSSQGSSSVFFETTQAAGTVSWGATSAVVASPALDARTYGIRAFVGDNTCSIASTTACRADADCGPSGGTCVFRREASNPVNFTATSSSVGNPPSISFVDTGWTACADGSRCFSDADCGGAAGSCSAAPNFGPSGQYATVFGIGFGTATGRVVFRDTGSGDDADGDVDFPAACAAGFWRDTSVTVKVPARYRNGAAVGFGAYTVQVVRAEDGANSNVVDFNLLDDAAGPSICAIDPVSGPVGTDVSFAGENLGSARGTAIFSPNQSVAPAVWGNQSVQGALVPSAAQTGPVLLRAASGSRSNGVAFEVADCRGDALICPEGTQCCTDGTCSAQCEAAVVDAHYAFRFSTGPIPKAPRLVYRCDATLASPSPWEGFSQPSAVCVNAAVSGTFDLPMDTATLNAANISVGKCVGGAGNPCGTVEPVASAGMVASATAFTWDPATAFDPDTTYQVALNGGQEAGAIASVDGEPMEADESWRFRTAPAGTVCTVGAVNVSPDDFMATEQGEQVPYASLPTSAGDRCVVLSCRGLTFDWASSQASRASVAQSSVADSCANSATALVETNPGSPAVISAAARVTGTPTGEGDLTVNFADPEVVAWAPDCEAACVNASIVASFNTFMDRASVEAAGAVRVFACEDESCEDNLVPFSVTSSFDPVEKRLTVTHAAPFVQDTFYRVILSGAMRSVSGVPLSVAGSNYGPDFSWTFKTKDSAVTCAIDRVEVTPAKAKATFVGQRKEFRATAFGAPDECSANGQALDPSEYAWAAWTARDDADTAPAPVTAATLMSNGSLALATASIPVGCTTSCVATGTSFTMVSPVCGNGRVDAGEDCDGGQGCTASCVHAGTEAPTCGNGNVDPGEDCDTLGNVGSGDGCSASCLNEGSAAVGATCGNGGNPAFAPAQGGEDCDDGNRQSGDGCSASCLNEGSTPATQATAVCGNSRVDAPAETCDDGNAADGDGCSARCVREGRVGGSICGDGVVTRAASGAGEDCDDGNTANGDGCSSTCRAEGSSIAHDPPSVCADGVVGTGESPACEAGLGAFTRVGPYAVAQADVGSAREIDRGESEADAEITSTAGTPAKSGDAIFAVQCSCQNDAACGSTGTLGCGAGSCCFERPSVVSVLPPTGSQQVCRNTLVQVDFTQKMDAATFDLSEGSSRDPQLSLELTAIGGAPVTAATCPHGTLAHGGSWFQKLWGGAKALFGRPVSAQAVGTRCLVPIEYQTSDAPGGGTRVVLSLKEALIANGSYQLVVAADANLSDDVDQGVLSADGVGLAARTTSTFVTGTDVCQLDLVDLTDLGRVESLAPNSTVPESRGVFTKTSEEHRLSANGAAVRNGAAQAIAPIAGVYDWSWSWGSDPANPDDEITVDVPALPPTGGTIQNSARATGKNGEENAYATALVTSDTLNAPSTAGRSVTGSKRLIAILCENPWPALDDPAGFPYVESATNYSFYYCRDAGEPGTDDDLPALNVVPTPASPITGILKETLYPVVGASAGVGVRVVSNQGYLPSDLWYRSQGFGGTPTATELDGYEAVRDGNTIYATAANQTADIFPNMYIFSVSGNAPSEAAAVFDQIATHWRFNANETAVSDVNLCRSSDGSYVDADGNPDNGVAFAFCEWDGDCATFATATCDAEKGKLRRDTKRLTDLVRMKSILDTYARTHSHCSLTRNQACTPIAPFCPGAETCVGDVPALAEGSFIRTMTTSAWPSWNDTLAKAVGALPTDPLNRFFQCAEGADPATCYNASSGQFSCARGSHVYGFQSVGGESYVLTTLLERTAASARWAFDIDANDMDNAALRAEYLAP
ncbi:hypothetical protein A2856_03725 [Candidatus Uhrbacteria bacterium RIFCSPHIGHO2_01_FULL_63_20]|uniref:Aminoacyl-transfer RNA synthetases class-II family profile domain-containing protein n=1 Tax=Candidatus Uhrbacteria bacterium RIFCSPHIGHO2_01_FULL_63_20 TaxID=1802385 RepID=A0A1F7TMF2_9BACT|nr:MAG: hypothetical protein A2856_03725 [Candidatus Uhrbacteria bacterium RIFCSPHIGHO2_01_FULL_63_20]